MIFYFSGTGNSLYVAKCIAQHNKEELVSISGIINNGDKVYEYKLKDNEIIGFVSPVYAWGPPQIVLEFIKKLKLSNYQDNYVFSVITCGGIIGNTMKVMTNSLKQKGINLKSGFSVPMPKNYILMGNVDSKESIKEKLSKADESIKNINRIIESRLTGVFQLSKGILPWLLTGLINPMFNKKAIDPKKFYVNDNCTGCRICEKVCNCKNITVKEKPQWGNNCTQCLACIHYCPAKAIQYGKNTEKKGRYSNPNITIDEMF